MRRVQKSMDNELIFRRFIARRFSCIVAALACLFVGGCQSETAKWEFARGMVAEEAGDSETAINLMEDAAAKAPNEVGLKLELATVLAENGDPQSLALCDEVIANHPPLKSPYRIFFRKESPLNDSPLGRKTICQQHLGEFEQALANLKLILADHVKRDKLELNALAYFRALAKRELTLAADDIELAIEQEEENRFPSGLYLSLRVKAAMAIGLTSRHLDRQRDVLSLLSKQIAGMELDYAKLQSIMARTVFAQIQSEFPLDKVTEQETELVRIKRDLTRAGLVSLLTVRALLYQDLDRSEFSNTDRLRVRELGYDADRLAERLPDKLTSLDQLGSAVTYLDTRGYVFGLLPWDNTAATDLDVGENSRSRISSYRESLADLDMAISSAETLRLAIDGSLYNIPQLSVMDVQQMLREIRRIEAVLLSHRVYVHERAEKPSRAEQDRQAIQALGFDPDGNLF